MSVDLALDLESLVREKVESGLYRSPDDVLREALRLLEDRDRLRAIRLEELRKEIAIGIDQADRGESAPFDAKETLARVRGRRGSGNGAG